MDRIINDQQEQLREMSARLDRERDECLFLRAIANRLVDDAVRELSRDDIYRG